MPHLTLVDEVSGQAYRIDSSDGLIGRDPSCAICLDGDSARTVSGRHARVFVADNQWQVEDAGSSNGTFVAGKRLEKDARSALKPGEVVRLGQTGPQLKVREAQARVIAATMLEQPQDALASATMPLRRSEALRAGLRDFGEPTQPGHAAPPQTQEIRVAVRGVQSGTRYAGQAELVTFGRAIGCTVRVEGEAANSVSRIHSEIVIEHGAPMLRDANSRNGTFLNGKAVTSPQPVRHGDLIALGSGGPAFTLDEATIVAGEPTSGNFSATQPPPAAAAPPKISPAPVAVPVDPPRGAKVAPKPQLGAATRLARASMSVGRTALFRNVLDEVSQKNNKRLRLVAWSTVAAGVVLTAGVGIFAKMQVDRTDRALEAERITFKAQETQMAARLDSVRTAATIETRRAQGALDSAMRASAPKAVLDSLRGQLADADRRTATLESSLKRAQLSLDKQLAAGDSIRRVAEQELARLRTQVTGAQATGADSRAVLDSLQRALARAEERAKVVGDQIRAVRGADLAQVSQLNQSAVGLVTTFAGREIFDGSGFAISPSGYFLTNRHVARPDTSSAADSIFVIMADQRTAARADIVMVTPTSGPDVALLKIRNYHGPYVAKIDWTSTHAVQGEPAALIGFPAGSDFALDSASVVRSSMSAGIFSKVTPELIQFDGFTVGGSSGSPIFNAGGEVVALHRAGLKQATGLGFAVPLSRLFPLLRPEIRTELGIH